LIDNNIVRIDTEFRKFLHQTFRLVDGEKLGDANTDLNK
jgi:hypothetical protein